MIAANDLMPTPAGAMVLVCLCSGTIVDIASGESNDESVRMTHGELVVEFRDNSRSPKVLSGLQSLFHRRAAPNFDAFDPDTPGASAGLNFEHIISGSANPNNAFTPRSGRYDLTRRSETSVRLQRQADDSPWAVASTLTYTLHAPHAVDFTFRCRPQDASRFGPHRYAVFFFADYMNDVEDVALHFRGVERDDAAETWIRADAPSGHPHHRSGGTYRNVDASALAYDDDHNFNLNLWSYDYPRFTEPFYYGRAAHGMVMILMFDRAHTENDEIRFSLFKFKVPRHPRPAWDFQYVVHRVESNREYGFAGRLIWKKFVSADDCRDEYLRWRATPGGNSLNDGRESQ